MSSSKSVVPCCWYNWLLRGSGWACCCSSPRCIPSKGRSALTSQTCLQVHASSSLVDISEGTYKRRTCVQQSKLPFIFSTLHNSANCCLCDLGSRWWVPRLATRFTLQIPAGFYSLSESCMYEASVSRPACCW